MKKGHTELVFILDRSGSMSGLEDDVIGGFNTMIHKQKDEAGTTNITTVLFDTYVDIIHDRFPLETVKPLGRKEYYVRGCTALLDAIGSTIHKVGNIQKYLPEEEKAEKVIFVITTDGMENSSHEYSYGKVKEMIVRQREKYGWEFLFLGANIDAVREAGRFGIHADRAVTYSNDPKGVAVSYRVVGETVSRMRASACMSEVGAEWKKEIEEDLRRRKSGGKSKAHKRQ